MPRNPNATSPNANTAGATIRLLMPLPGATIQLLTPGPAPIVLKTYAIAISATMLIPSQ